RNADVAAQQRAVVPVELQRRTIGAPAPRIVDRATAPRLGAALHRHQVVHDLEADDAPLAELGVGVPAVTQETAAVVERRAQTNDLAAKSAAAGPGHPLN